MPAWSRLIGQRIPEQVVTTTGIRIYEQWQSSSGISHSTVQLGALIDNYSIEMETKLMTVLQSMKQQWS